jgi:hypothetical protein
MSSYTKFCFRCREKVSADLFYVVPNGTFTRKDRLCMPCRDFKNTLRTNASVRERIFQSPAMRQRELALIPNPFDKKIMNPDANSFYLLMEAL